MACWVVSPGELRVLAVSQDVFGSKTASGISETPSSKSPTLSERHGSVLSNSRTVDDEVAVTAYWATVQVAPPWRPLPGVTPSPQLPGVLLPARNDPFHWTAMVF
jgi:hypothetical protein